MNFNGSNKSNEKISRAYEQYGSSDALEQEWQAFAGLVDNKLLLPSKQPRLEECVETMQRNSDCSKTETAHVSISTNSDTGDDTDAQDEQCLSQKRDDYTPVRNSGVPQQSSFSEEKGRNGFIAEKHGMDSFATSRKSRHSRSSSKHSGDYCRSDHKHMSSNYHRSSGRKADSSRHGDHHRHHSPDRTTRRHSRDRRRSRSSERWTRRSSRDNYKRYDDRYRRHNGKTHRRSRSRSVDQYKIQEETMEKLMKLASDGQLDLTKISLSEIMKTIIVPKEYRHNQQHAMRYQMAQLTERIEQLTGVKIPSFYCTGAVNPLVYAEQMRKRKLLWSGKNPQSTSTAKVGIAMTEGQDEKTAEKFRKLLGIRDQSSIQTGGNESNDIIKRQNEAFQALDREYELARITTHTHRGTGLGFLSAATMTASSCMKTQEGNEYARHESGGGRQLRK